MTDDAFHLTALDARRYDFGNALRGYDRARVDVFREQVAEELERLSRANQELEIKARNFHEQLRAFRERDKALNDALISAQQLRGEIREQAQREAQLIIREAQGDAERNVEVLRGEIRRAEDDLQQLWRNRRSYVQQLRQLVERQLHDLDSAEMVPPPAGLVNSETTRDQVREIPVREPRAREANSVPVREFQTPRDAPPAAPVNEKAVPVQVVSMQPVSVQPVPAQPVPVQAAPVQAAPVQAAPVQVVPVQAVPLPPTLQQPWARPAATHQAAPQQVAAQQAELQQAPTQHPAPHRAATPDGAAQQSAPHQAAPAPLMQPVPHPLPPATPSPQAVAPLPPRPSLPTPSWLDVVEGE